MPSALVPLPPTPFLVADAYAVGCTRDQLRHPALHAPVRGVRMAASSADDLEALCRAVALTFRDGDTFSHLTAAALLGLPLPAHHRPLERLHVSSRAGLRPREAALIVGHSGAIARHSFRQRQLPVTVPARTWLDLGSMTGTGTGAHLTVEDLVVLTDAVLGLRHPATTRLQLERALSWFVRGRGRQTLRTALAAARSFVDSPMETRVRLQLVASGFPCPVVGADLLAEDQWVARPDMCWPQARIAIEYDGAHHYSSQHQMRSDVARRENMERLGWRVIVLYSQDVLTAWEATCGRLITAFEDQGVDLRRLADAPDTPVRARVVVARR
ncbi:DUF559 domain-containing protein [Oerskovia sp. Root22]|uniref:DUF559 domain-containing protein n=1 Tax=Oerskovia sp. Root22 TaxID=1736494 RepID=UPI0006F3FEDF|nr:DUF559 domain-containing protein [Oerskovia sp. Root22]KRC34234.1 hypothetical protein ASE15_13810 [Oerskovia sp. Root22]